MGWHGWTVGRWNGVGGVLGGWDGMREMMLGRWNGMSGALGGRNNGVEC